MRTLQIILLVVFLLSLLTGVRMIEPGERAVIKRFGRVLDYKPGPGLYVGLPWGIDEIYRVQVQRVRSVQIGYLPELDDESGQNVPAGQLVTGDHNLVNIQATLYFVVHDDEVEKFVFQQERAEDLLARAGEAVLSQWVASHEVDTVILTGKAAKLPGGRQSLRDVLVEQTQERLADYQLGIEIKDARITLLNPPAPVKEAFDEVYQAETQIKTLEYKAREYATRQISDAQADAYQVKQKADAYHYQQKTQAEALAKSFEKWVATAEKMKKQDPDYLNAIWWDQITEVYAILGANGKIYPHDGSEMDFTIVPKK